MPLGSQDDLFAVPVDYGDAVWKPECNTNAQCDSDAERDAEPVHDGDALGVRDQVPDAERDALGHRYALAVGDANADVLAQPHAEQQSDGYAEPQRDTQLDELP